MILKEGKARWVYTCDLCNVRATYPDHFRAVEKQQRHVRSWGHESNAISQAMQAMAKPVTEAMQNLGLAWGNIAEVFTSAANAMQSSYALAPPPNLPHDPRLLRDRRKWGGR